MLGWLLDADQKRRKLLQQAPRGPLWDYLNTPFPDRNLPLEQVPLLAIDFETTGLDTHNDHLLSVGHVELKGNQILLASAHHQIIHSDHDMAEQNIGIHRITHDQLANGISLRQAVKAILQALQGKVLLAHHARVEIGFLQQACKRLYGVAPILPSIDTLHLARKRLDRAQQPYQPNELRLFNLRKRYGLPDYQAHNALMDAIATAELFLAQVAHGNYRRSPPLKQFARYP